MKKFARQPLTQRCHLKARCCKHSLRCSSPACWLGLMLTCPVIMCVVSVQTADFNGICLVFARRQSAAQGWETEKAEIPRRTRQPKAQARPWPYIHVVEVGRKKIYILIASFLSLPSLAFRRTVLATIFSISIVRM